MFDDNFSQEPKKVMTFHFACHLIFSGLLYNFLIISVAMIKISAHILTGRADEKMDP